MRWSLLCLLGLVLVFPGRADASAEGQIIAAGNAYRQQERRPALRADPLLMQLAQQHAQAMASGRTKFGHGGFGDRSRQIMREVPGCGRVGENVAMRSGTDVSAAAFVAQWKVSRPHRKNLLAAFDVTGVGLARNAQGAVYAVQLFAEARAGSVATNAPYAPEVSGDGLMIGVGGFRTR